MNSSQARVELFIDVFEETGQRALALSELKPSELVSAILQEFHDLEHLGDNAEDYYLAKAESREPLDAETSLAKQVRAGDRLMLAEREAPMPGGTRRPPASIYLREQRAAKAFRVPYLPAIIGRRSENQPLDELVAVDLRSFASGLRVSRRHVRLTETGGDFYVENLSTNPVLLISPRWPSPLAVSTDRLTLLPGDIIRLDRSDIELKFILRSAVAAAAPAPGAATSAANDVAAAPAPEQV
jgi:hypothetical protein